MLMLKMCLMCLYNNVQNIITSFFCRGYMSLEYASFGQLSTKVDVYSFGVLLLEIISGRKTILEIATNKMNLVEWVSIFE